MKRNIFALLFIILFLPSCQGQDNTGIEEYVKAVRQFEKAIVIDSTKNNVNQKIKNLKNYHGIK